MKKLCEVLLVASVLSAVFTVSKKFPDTMIAPKWYAAILLTIVGGMVCAVYFLFTKRKDQEWRLLSFAELTMVVVGGLQAVFFLMQELGFISKEGASITGSFANVAGFASCVCLVFPLGWQQAKTWNKPWQVLFYLSKAVCAIAVVWSGSRTGTLCLLLWGAWMTLPKQRKTLALGMPLFVALLAFGFKTDSSRGRWLILQRTCELIGRRPLAGWGPDGFEAHYMDVQADYFRMHPDSEYALLADNIRHPLNEFLDIAANYGIVGLVVVVLFVGGVVRHHVRHPSAASSAVLQVMSVMGVFSLFSYPFHYPFTWLMVLWILAASFRRQLMVSRTPVCIVLSVLLPVVGIVTFRHALQEMELRKIQDKAGYGLAERMLPRYARLYPSRKSDFRFLYNDAFTQYEAGHYPEALQTARECQKLLADYDLSLLLGDIFRAQGQQDSTLYYYGRAHEMCPSRLTPLYEMFSVFRSAGDTVRCRQMQKTILAKPVKVKSKVAEEMLKEVRSY